MPTYAYACSACEHAFDVRQSFSDQPLTTCPQCERETLRKLFSPVGVVFKGSGFYRTDSRAAKGTGPGARTAPRDGGSGARNGGGSDGGGSDGGGSDGGGSDGGSDGGGSGSARTKDAAEKAPSPGGRAGDGASGTAGSTATGASTAAGA